ncbi:uncharacterized protein DFL_004498 [Arthrobotrys flagrans]|uniref:Uncharacterized protein n=1 Tax=Arthrobotrys flagrans TaxID=97331 RepID=A0A437A532_ARTFL|nr:hypothetical protein DFL_004498 [Arthrobotrys flagrans]
MPEQTAQEISTQEIVVDSNGTGVQNGEIYGEVESWGFWGVSVTIQNNLNGTLWPATPTTQVTDSGYCATEPDTIPGGSQTVGNAGSFRGRALTMTGVVALLAYRIPNDPFLLFVFITNPYVGDNDIKVGRVNNNTGITKDFLKNVEKSDSGYTKTTEFEWTAVPASGGNPAVKKTVIVTSDIGQDNDCKATVNIRIKQ